MGLKSAIAKMKSMRFNTVNDEKVIVCIEEIEDIDSFVYLGTKVTTSGGADDDFMSKERAVFGKLMSIWKSSQLSKSTKKRIYKSNVIAVLLYGCKS